MKKHLTLTTRSRLTPKRKQSIAAWRPTMQNAICAAAGSVDESLALWSAKLRFLALSVRDVIPDSQAVADFESAIASSEIPLCNHIAAPAQSQRGGG